MKIDLAEVRRIARLAHLEFEEPELPLLADQLSEILTYMESLSRLDTERVEPTFHPITGATPLREDSVQPGLGAETATRGAPGGVQGQFVVPKVIG